MVTIQITEEVKNNTELVYLLQHIAKLIDQGFTRGYDPNWEISGEETFDETD